MVLCCAHTCKTTRARAIRIALLSFENEYFLAFRNSILSIRFLFKPDILIIWIVVQGCHEYLNCKYHAIIILVFIQILKNQMATL